MAYLKWLRVMRLRLIALCGGVLAILFGVYQNFIGHNITWNWQVVLGVVAVLGAAYLTWRDEHKLRIEAESAIRQIEALHAQEIARLNNENHERAKAALVRYREKEIQQLGQKLEKLTKDNIGLGLQLLEGVAANVQNEHRYILTLNFADRMSEYKCYTERISDILKESFSEAEAAYFQSDAGMAHVNITPESIISEADLEAGRKNLVNLYMQRIRQLTKIIEKQM